MSKMTTAQNRALHQMLNALGQMENKAVIIMGATNGRTASSTELSIDEANVLLKRLGDELEQKTGPTRRKILHLMALMGYTTTDGKIDYQRVDQWVKSAYTGEANPRRVGLKALTPTEINRVCSLVEARYKATISAKK